jgi:hypothetical protein
MRITLLCLLVIGFFCPTLVAQTKVTKLGIIGLDTSHVSAFSKLLNDPKREGMKVVAAYPGGSPDIESSHSRVAGFTAELKKLNVEIVDSIPALLEKVDAVLLESVDGRPHLAQALPVLKSGKPMFIDKPLAGSLADAIAIDMLGKKYQARWFSSSSLRFSQKILSYRDPKLKDTVRGADAWSPCSLEKTHPDLFWYGVHGVEILYTIMGEGCETVTRTAAGNTDLVVGVWKGGRVGTFRGIRDGKAGYGAVVFGSGSIEFTDKYDGYAPLVEQFVKFFDGAEAPVPNQETLELFAFMEAADQSKAQGGVPVKIADVVAKATEEAKAKVLQLDK